MDDLQVHLRTNPQGVTNLPGPQERTTGQQGLADLMNLSIGRLTISHSAFFWNDQRQPVEIDAHELAILLSMTRGRYNGTLSSSATTIRSSGWSSPPITFNSRFELSPASLVFSSFAWQTQGTAGEASFTILPHPVLQATGSFHASAEILPLAHILHAPELRGGTLQVEGRAVYQDGTISAQGRAQARQVAILTPALPSLDWTPRQVTHWKKTNSISPTSSSRFGEARRRERSRRISRTRRPKFRLNSQLHQVRLDSVLAPRARRPSSPPNCIRPRWPTAPLAQRGPGGGKG